MTDSLTTSLERLRSARVAANPTEVGAGDNPTAAESAGRPQPASDHLMAAASGLPPDTAVVATGTPRIALTLRAALVGVFAVLALGGGVVSARLITTTTPAMQAIAEPRTEPGPVGLGAEPGEPQPADPALAATGSLPAPVPQVVVHVTGEVNLPGVVALPAGARVADAMELAGGPTPTANLSAINLARVVEDGEQIVIPAPGEAEPSPPPPPPTLNLTEVADESGRINLNHAGSPLLQQLPGIGPALAERIIEHRNAAGGFEHPEQLTDVPGIGPAIMENVRDRVTV